MLSGVVVCDFADVGEVFDVVWSFVCVDGDVLSTVVTLLLVLSGEVALCILFPFLSVVVESLVLVAAASVVAVVVILVWYWLLW